MMRWMQHSQTPSLASPSTFSPFGEFRLSSGASVNTHDAVASDHAALLRCCLQGHDWWYAHGSREVAVSGWCWCSEPQ